MCDTMIFFDNKKNIIFAKNSDRHYSEPHIIEHVKAKNHRANKLVKMTYVSIPQVKRTNECVLLKPSWIWGAEMGWNEFGLHIGNEAVESHILPGEKKGVIGMDYLRLALERAKTPLEAIEVITSLLEKYNQSGNCGFIKSSFYHNSFLISNSTEAYVLETVSNHWAYKKLDSPYSISNALTLEKDFDECSQSFEDYCKESKVKEKNLKFVLSESQKDYSGDQRRAFTFKNIQKELNNKQIIQMLSAHDIDEKKSESICMHLADSIWSTTGSYFVTLQDNKNEDIIWLTLSPFPCMSVYKPVFYSNVKLYSKTPKKKQVKYWKKRQLLFAKLEKEPNLLQEYKKEKDELQQTFFSYFEDRKNLSEDEKMSLCKLCKIKEDKFIKSWCDKTL